MPHPSAYEHLKTWLNSRRKYNEGLALLLSYGDKPALHENLSLHKNEKKLASELVKLFAEVKGENAKHPSPTPSALRAPSPKGEGQTAEQPMPRMDKAKQGIYKQYVANLKEIESLRSNNYFIGRDPVTHEERPLTETEIEQRKEISKLIMDADDKSRELIASMDFYDSTGKLPETITTQPQSPSTVPEGDLYLKKENSRKMISKLKGKIAEGEKITGTIPNDKLAKHLNKIAEWKQKLQTEELNFEQYEKQFNGQ